MASIAEAFNCPDSMALALLKSKGFERWKKAREHEIKWKVGVMARIDNLTRAIVNFMRGVAR